MRLLKPVNWILYASLSSIRFLKFFKKYADANMFVRFHRFRPGFSIWGFFLTHFRVQGLLFLIVWLSIFFFALFGAYFFPRFRFAILWIIMLAPHMFLLMVIDHMNTAHCNVFPPIYWRIFWRIEILKVILGKCFGRHTSNISTFSPGQGSFYNIAYGIDFMISKRMYNITIAWFSAVPADSHILRLFSFWKFPSSHFVHFLYIWVHLFPNQFGFFLMIIHFVLLQLNPRGPCCLPQSEGT